MGAIVCFGEVLLRFSAPGRERLLQSPGLDLCVGGAEANVAVSLALLGTEVRMASILPDNALGKGARDELRRHGVDVSRILWRPGRMGLYFLTVGAVLRPSEVLYDRAGSAFEAAPSDLVDWDEMLAGADRLHLSGITPALGPGSAQAAQRAVESASRLGVPVSMDGNYRAKLWERWDSDSASILRDLFAHAEIAFADERDIGLMLKRDFAGDLAGAASAAFEAFPRLQCIACTRRAQRNADDHDLSAVLIRRDRTIETGPYAVTSVVDRIGAGDAFVAGLLHSLAKGKDDREALDFGLAAAVLKHSIPGDFNLVDENDVNMLLSDGGMHVRR